MAEERREREREKKKSEKNSILRKSTNNEWSCTTQEFDLLSTYPNAVSSSVKTIGHDSSKNYLHKGGPCHLLTFVKSKISCV